HIGEHGGANEVAAVQVLRTAGTAGDQFRALVDAGLDQALDLVVLNFADHRTEIGFRIVDVADDNALGRGLGDRLDLLLPVGGDEHPGRRVARLPAVAHHADHALRHRGLEIHVGQQDVGRFAAQFLTDPLDGGRGGLGYQNTGTRGAG